MAKKIYLTQDRFDFPKLLIPVFKKVDLISDYNPQQYDITFSLNNSIGLEGVNFRWENDEVYWGGSNVYSDKIGYDRILGIDNVELYVSSDSHSDFYDEDGFVTISENGFIKSFYSDVQIIKPIDIELNYSLFNENYYKLDGIFEKGNKLLEKYSFRKGNFVKGYGKQVIGPCFVAVLLLVPQKRDLDYCAIKIFTAKTNNELNSQIALYDCSIDPSRNKFSQRYIYRCELGKQVAIIGFLVAAAHLTLFDYNAKCSIAGVSNHIDYE